MHPCVHLEGKPAMNMSSWAYALIMLATGVGIPIMAALNATLGVRLQSGPIAATILFALALMISLCAAVMTGGLQRPLWNAAPWPFYLGGTLVAFYVLSVTVIAPRFGLGNAVFFVLVGQIASAAAIDHFGLFGASRSEISIARACGVIL